MSSTNATPNMLRNWRKEQQPDGNWVFHFRDGGILYWRCEEDGSLQMVGNSESPSYRELCNRVAGIIWPKEKGIDLIIQAIVKYIPEYDPAEEFTDSSSQEGHGDSNTSINWRAFWPANRSLRQTTNAQSPCQEALLVDWATILTPQRQSHHLLAHAPTGLGKTIAALVPALSWLAQAPTRRQLYYLVNRVTQHQNPIRELQAGLAETFLQQSGHPLRVVDLVGRRLLCTHPDERRPPRFCQQSRQNSNFELLPKGVLDWQAVKHHLGSTACPYHTLQGLLPKAQIIICDYWWFFSQLAVAESDNRLLNIDPANAILVVDEAHNLPLRVRAELDVDLPLSQMRERLPQVPVPVQHCLQPLLEMARRIEPETGFAPSEASHRAGGDECIEAALNALSTGDAPMDSVPWPERILRLLQQSDEIAVIYTTVEESAEPRLVLRLIDPTAILQIGYQRVYASLSMSGSLAAPTDDQQEMRYLLPLFGLPPTKTITRKYASPFSLRHQYWLCNGDTYGAYARRAQHLERYTDHIIRAGRAVPGVTAVFFSSYDFLQQIYKRMPQGTEQPLVVAESQADAGAELDLGQGLSTYENRLRKLVETQGRAYLFGVYKGKLAEGASFDDNLIKNVICVSIPLDYPGLFQQRLTEHYQQILAPIAAELGDDLAAKAWEYAIERPSLSLVLQACGRGIRREADRCTFLLLDQRYTSPVWRRFLPSGPYNIAHPEQVIQTFYRPTHPQDETVWDSTLLPARPQPGGF